MTLGLCLAATACDKQADADKSAAADKKVEGDKADEADKKEEGEATDDKVLADADADAANEGCLHGKDAHDEGSCDQNTALATGVGHFGDEFTIEESKPLSEVLGGTGEEPVLVSGEVSSVCQSKGCWMVIKDGDKQARVLMKDHKFAVPMDGQGKKAVVEGTVEEKTLSEAQVKHIEKDAGRDPDAVSGERTEYILTATGVRLDAES